MGTSAAEQAQKTFSVDCPFQDDYRATGSKVGAVLADLTGHIRDAHTSDVPEPPRTQVKNSLTACANTFGTLPI